MIPRLPLYFFDPIRPETTAMSPDRSGFDCQNFSMELEKSPTTGLLMMLRLFRRSCANKLNFLMRINYAEDDTHAPPKPESARMKSSTFVNHGHGWR
mmetsp:Transcript_6298/g.11084  ORF Transcript_6298/g.11084 Transcript_6298/m.11084 type:complete len:97 (+) Transcript_6298:1178-1468(+)